MISLSNSESGKVPFYLFEKYRVYRFQASTCQEQYIYGNLISRRYQQKCYCSLPQGFHSLLEPIENCISDIAPTTQMEENIIHTHFKAYCTALIV